MLEELKILNEILKEIEIGIGFDAELFGQIVNSITVDSVNNLLSTLQVTSACTKNMRERTVLQIMEQRNTPLSYIIENSNVIIDEAKFDIVQEVAE